MSDDAIYVTGAVLTVLALRSRAPWTRVSGMVLGAILAGLLVTVVLRLDDGGAHEVAALLFLGPAAALCWHMLHERRKARARNAASTSGPERRPNGTAPGDAPMRTIPDAALRPFVAVWGPSAAVLATVLLAALWPAGPPTWPPWPLRGVEWLALRVEPWIAVQALPALAILALVAVPVFDTRASLDPPPQDPASDPQIPAADHGFRRDEIHFFVLSIVLLGLLPLGLALFGPASPPPATRPLSERLWIDLLATPAPAFWAAREAPGIAFLGLLFVGLPIWLPRWPATRGAFERHRKRLGGGRYALLAVLCVALLYVPLRVTLGWALSVGAIVHLPEAGLSF